MTLDLVGKDLILKGSSPKIEDKQVPGTYCMVFSSDLSNIFALFGLGYALDPKFAR